MVEVPKASRVTSIIINKIMKYSKRGRTLRYKKKPHARRRKFRKAITKRRKPTKVARRKTKRTQQAIGAHTFIENYDLSTDANGHVLFVATINGCKTRNDGLFVKPQQARFTEVAGYYRQWRLTTIAFSVMKCDIPSTPVETCIAPVELTTLDEMPMQGSYRSSTAYRSQKRAVRWAAYTRKLPTWSSTMRTSVQDPSNLPHFYMKMVAVGQPPNTYACSVQVKYYYKFRFPTDAQ